MWNWINSFGNWFLQNSHNTALKRRKWIVALENSSVICYLLFMIKMTFQSVWAGSYIMKSFCPVNFALRQATHTHSPRSAICILTNHRKLRTSLSVLNYILKSVTSVIYLMQHHEREQCTHLKKSILHWKKYSRVLAAVPHWKVWSRSR